MFGFLNIYKPKGKTSHDVVAILRRVTKIKQIGHTGTLDPFAEGVLPICIGKATRLIEFLEDDKAYIGTIQFGNATDSYDLEGSVTNTSSNKTTENEIREALKNFTGEIEQLPPIYSAIKVNGKKLYDYARKGENIEIKPRKVFIKEIKLLNFNKEEQTAEVYIECSKGTYIRSIANDLGLALNTYGHLIKLVRVKAGKFLIENSIKLENIDNFDKVKLNLINPLEFLDYPKYELNEKEREAVSHGNSIKTEGENGIVILISNDEIIAVAENIDGWTRCKKVFL